MPFLKSLTGSALTALALASLCLPASFGRNQWEINHGAHNPPVDPKFMPGGQFSGYVPKSVGADFWKVQGSNRIPIGTVLTVILESDLSSSKNKPGDTFMLTLQDGFVLGDKQLIPPKSKILGSVVAAMPARAQRGGHPGNLQISLQSLVFPDGRHLPIYGMIDYNPNMAQQSPAKVKNLGVSIADYGQAVAGMAVSFVTGPGWMMKKMHRGLDFQLSKGEVLPVRLTRSLEIPQSIASTAGAARSLQQPTGMVDPSGPVQVPVPGMAPGGMGAPGMGAPGAPSGYASQSSSSMPPVAPPRPTTSAANDNAIFEPITAEPVGNIPDPF